MSSQMHSSASPGSSGCSSTSCYSPVLSSYSDDASVNAARCVPIHGSYVYVESITFGSLPFYPKRFFRARRTSIIQNGRYNNATQTHICSPIIPAMNNSSPSLPLESRCHSTRPGLLSCSSTSSDLSNVDSVWDSGYSSASTANTTPVSSSASLVEVS